MKTSRFIFFILSTLSALSVCCIYFSLPHIARADYPRAALGDTIVIGEFVFEDDYTAASAPNCTITIYNPAGTLKVNAGSMTTDANGWTHYSYAIGAGETEGNWPAIMSCGSSGAGTLIKADKTFTVGATISASTTVATAVWNNTTRTLSAFGSLAADVWNDAFAPTRRLTDSTLSGGGSFPTTAEFNSKIDTATSTIITEILANRTLINNLNDISAVDVWNAANRTLTDYSTSTIASSTAYAVWDRAAAQLTSIGSIGKLLADNIDATISSRGTSNLSASDIWSAGTRTLTDYATSSIPSYVATAVWSNAARTLTNYGNDITAADVWNVLTSGLTTVNSIGKLLTDNIDTTISSRASLANQVAGWTAVMSDQSAVQTGKTYRAKIEIRNSNSVATAPFAAPRVTLYDAERNTVVSDVAMTSIATGVYEYTYSVSSGAAQGVWETVVSTQVESGKTITNNDYWIVAGSPAQVLINSVTGEVPTATANITITNEGLAGYEYQYEWCVVVDQSNQCGGGDDTYHATAAKFINPGEDWNTNLTATVSAAGSYYFKLIVYFGTEKSGSSRSFTIEEPEDNGGGGTGGSGGSGGGGGGGGGGRGGGGGSGSANTNTPIQPQTGTGTPVGANFNGDGIVNSVDFSILLAYWKLPAPASNPSIDINHDGIVNSVDFSILLSQWGTAGHAL